MRLIRPGHPHDASCGIIISRSSLGTRVHPGIQKTNSSNNDSQPIFADQKRKQIFLGNVFKTEVRATRRGNFITTSHLASVSNQWRGDGEAVSRRPSSTRHAVPFFCTNSCQQRVRHFDCKTGVFGVCFFPTRIDIYDTINSNKKSCFNFHPSLLIRRCATRCLKQGMQLPPPINYAMSRKLPLRPAPLPISPWKTEHILLSERLMRCPPIE